MMTKQNTKYEPHPEPMVEREKLSIRLYKKCMTHISRICMVLSHHDVSTRFGDDDDDDDDKPYQPRLNRAEKTKRCNSVRKDTIRFSIYIRNISSLVLAVAFQAGSIFQCDPTNSSKSCQCPSITPASDRFTFSSMRNTKM
jgi:hypothetical protein